MEYLVVFNPLSKEGKKEKTFDKLAKLLKVAKDQLVMMSIINITNFSQIQEVITSETNIILVGGDGTINRFANLLAGHKVNNNIYLFKAGTGNDFGRSIDKKKRLVLVNYYFNNLPTVKIKTTDSKFFVNGVGIGVDGMVCHYVNHNEGNKTKVNYFKQAIRAFKNSKRFEVILKTNGVEELSFEKVWFVSIMYGKYFGGGMKIAPKANRDSDDLTVVIVRKVPKWLLILIFPTIYLGIHSIFKRYIKFITVKNVLIKTSKELYAQVDGDDYLLVNEIEIKR